MNQDQLDKKLRQWITQAKDQGLSEQEISAKVSELYLNFCDEQVKPPNPRPRIKKNVSKINSEINSSTEERIN